MSRRTLSGAIALTLLGAVVVLSGTSVRGADVRSAPLARSGRSSPSDEFGVAGRKVRDVVAETRGARRMASLSPEFVSLADDPTAYVDTDGALFYAEINVGANTSLGPVVQPAPAGAEPAFPTGEQMGLSAADGPSVAEGVAAASGNTFALNSRPGSTKTIYLDFDGETVSGSAWNQTRGIPTKVAPPFDRDGVPGSFSATEQQIIRDTWQAVAEDFAPFDVNVTTQRPGIDAFLKSDSSDQTYGVMAVVTNENWLCGTGCSGIAYVDVFDDPDLFYSPAWVFPPPLYSAVGIANIVSHEVGHNLSLSHDGQGTSPYYGGTSVWGPIMGNPGSQYVQWSKGEYSGATNTEDDIAKIGIRTGPAPDSSTGFADAVLVAPGVNVTTADDVVSSATDVDYYAIDVTNGFVQVILRRSSIASNLAPRVAFYNSAGANLSGLYDYSLSGTFQLFAGYVPNGRYFVQVGAGASPGNFSTYGSLGYYNLGVYRPDNPSNPTGLTATATGDRTITASWSPSTVAQGRTVAYEAQLCDSVSVCTAATTTSATSIALTAPAATGSFSARVTAVDSLGVRSAAVTSSAVAVLSRPTAPLVQKLRWDESSRTLSVEWVSGTSYPPVATNSVTLTLTNRATSEQLVIALPNDAAGSLTRTLTASWSSVWIDTSMVSFTASPSPWNQSAPGPVASVFTGRLDAPQTPASPTTIARPSAPQTPGLSGGTRGAAPQA